MNQFFKVFSHYGRWTFIHPSLAHRGGAILNLYRTKKRAIKAADSFRNVYMTKVVH